MFQGGRGVHQGRGEAPSYQRPTAESLAALRVSGELPARQNRRDNLSICHSPLHCDLLSRDASRVQALQGVQHDGKRNQDRGRRSAGRHGPVLHRRDAVHHLVHVRASSAVPRLSLEVRFRQGHHEHD